MTSREPVGPLPEHFAKSSGRRKLSAIVYADVVGYSRLIELDDVGTVARLRHLRSSLIEPAVREHGGKIVQTGGDSLLILFDSIDGAVQCALSVQRLVPVHDAAPPDRCIRFRVGINIGDIIAEGTDFHGDGVNVAARLQAECPPGAICVSRSVRDHVRGLHLNFAELGLLNLKNIAKPVQAYVLRPDAEERMGVPPVSTEPSSVRPAPPPLLLVLPFENLAEPAIDGRLADLITEDVTTGLARISGRSVLARQTALAYRKRSVDVQRLHRQFGVRYVVQGSVRQAAGHARISVQVIDAMVGSHIWADQFDTDCSAHRFWYDEVTARLVRTLHLAIQSAATRETEWADLSRMQPNELIRRGWAALSNISRQSFDAGLAHFDRALAMDATATHARVGAAYVLLATIANGWSTNEQADQSRSEQLLDGVPARYPNDATVHLAMALLRRLQNRYSEARIECNAAIALDPHNPVPLCELGISLVYSGDPEAAIPCFEKSIRLSPHDPGVPGSHSMLGLARLLLGETDKAVEELRRAIALNPALQYAHLFLAAALGLQGEFEHAGVALAEARKLDPAILSQERVLAAEAAPQAPRYRELVSATLVAGLRSASSGRPASGLNRA